MKLTIVLATYNPNLSFLKEQIDSICKQTFMDWSCLIVDDASSLESINQIKSLIQNDDRFVLHQNQKNLGSIYNFERGLKLVSADSDFIALCDQDDIWLPEKLETMIHEFSNPQVLLVHSDLKLMDAQGAILSESCWVKEERDLQNINIDHFIYRNIVTGCAAMFRASLLKQALPFPLDNHYFYHHDAWLALLALNQGKIVSIKKPLVLYRQHGSNVVGSSQTKGVLQTVQNKSFKEIFKKCLLAYESRTILAKDYFQRTGGQNFFYSTKIIPSLFFKFGFNRYTIMTAVGKIIKILGVFSQQKIHNQPLS